MRQFRGILIGLAFALGGCVDLGPGWGCGADCLRQLHVRPDSGSNVLRGDTIRVWSWSGDGSALATWTVEGGAFAFVSDDALATEVTTPTDRVIVRALALGQGTIVATKGTLEASTVLNIADSSVITTLDAGTLPFAPFKVGEERTLEPVLRDASFKKYVTRPVWSSSDSLTVNFDHRFITACFFCDPAPGSVTYVRALRTGTVQLIASFLTLRDTLEITVVP